MKPFKRKWGWTPDQPDQRDHVYKIPRAENLPFAKPLPQKVDLRPGCSPVEDQEDLGSCTAQALVGALEFLEKKQGQKFVDMSRLFLYYNERVIEGSVRWDSGAMIRDGIKTLAKQGCCLENSWPYDMDQFKTRPPATAYREALDHQILTYSRISTLTQMKACLADGFPFVFGFTVYESFESEEVARTGIVTMPKKSESKLGGHAVMACGYDDGKELFIVRNSWGTDWGLNGYFLMPYAYLKDRNLSDDFWTIRKQENG